MKKLLLILTVLSSLLFISCDDKTSKDVPNVPDVPDVPAISKLQKINYTRIYSDSKQKEEHESISFYYGENGYVSKVIADEEDYQYITIWTYNNDNQLTKEDWTEINKYDNSRNNSQTSFNYNDKGQIVSTKHMNLNEENNSEFTSYFEYNTDGLMVKEFDSDDLIIYEYNDNNKLAKSYNMSEEENYTIFKWDNKKSPYANMLTKAIIQINMGDETVYFNNILLWEMKATSSNYKTTNDYTYDAKGYPMTCNKKSYENNILLYTETSEYIYE